LPHTGPDGFPAPIVLERLLPPILLALLIGVLAPWSLDRVRHT
jgi:hypothetical protein